ncbi:hypothetical protein [Sphingomonas abietis]|uniref:DUF4169 family protein n=1 Tax=Sphingomonas abietis TaxID=3012344 RepID=A0ABY7NVL7_9SPHN|nr:hypothetical protein [Sphingomonas abietis]WBO23954.1 hypothetical protein PBT88_07545 [Sphingomonas abietis]
MIAARLSRRKKAAILASPPRALRLRFEQRLSARQQTQTERERAYRIREARQIHETFQRDALMNQGAQS